MASSSLSLHWERMKRLAICSFGIKKQDFPKIKFSRNIKERRRMFQLLTKINTLKLNILYAKGQYEDTLLIHIMWSLASRPNEILTLRFEDFEVKDGQKSVLYYANKKNQRKKFTIFEELYSQVMNFKEMKVNNRTYQIRSFTTPTGKNNYRPLCFWFDKIKTSKDIFKKVCKVNYRYEIKTKRHQNIIYFKWF